MVLIWCKYTVVLAGVVVVGGGVGVGDGGGDCSVCGGCYQLLLGSSS